MNIDSVTLSRALLCYLQLHIHIVVAAAAFYGAFNQVLSALGGSDQCVVLRSFFQPDVPTMIAKFFHDKAVLCSVSRLLTPEVGGDSKDD